MRKFHSIAALCGDGLRPELKALFERLAVDPHSELVHQIPCVVLQSNGFAHLEF
jgi:hypothetical protein